MADLERRNAAGQQARPADGSADALAALQQALGSKADRAALDALASLVQQAPLTNSSSGAAEPPAAAAAAAGEGAGSAPSGPASGAGGASQPGGEGAGGEGAGGEGAAAGDGAGLMQQLLAVQGLGKDLADLRFDLEALRSGLQGLGSSAANLRSRVGRLQEQPAAVATGPAAPPSAAPLEDGGGVPAAAAAAGLQDVRDEFAAAQRQQDDELRRLRQRLADLEARLAWLGRGTAAEQADSTTPPAPSAEEVAAAAAGGRSAGGLLDDLSTALEQLRRRVDAVESSQSARLAQQQLPLQHVPAAATKGRSADEEGSALASAAALASVAAQMQGSIRQLEAALNEVASAVAVLAAGPAASGGAANTRDGGSSGAVGAGGAGGGGGGAGGGAGGVGASAGGGEGPSLEGEAGWAARGLARLAQLVRAGRVSKKLDEFDPRLLSMAQQLAATHAMVQRLQNSTDAVAAAATAGRRSQEVVDYAGHRGSDGSGGTYQLQSAGDATTLLAGSVRPPGAARGGAAAGTATAADQQPATAGALRELEGRVRKLAGQVKQLQLMTKGATGSAVGAVVSTFAADGDHAMLSSRPAVLGYRCMACDRPLAALAEAAGPWVPGGAMPPPLPLPPAWGEWDGEAAAGRARSPAPPGGGGGAAAMRRRTDGALGASWDGGQLPPGSPPRPPGTAPTAADLPAALLGPRLPPGGWRGGIPAVREDGGLPQISKGHTPSVSGRPTREA